MIFATNPIQRPADAKLLVVDGSGVITHRLRRHWLDCLRPGDLVIANDAATIPASLSGRHLRTGLPIEIRLAARRSLSPTDVECFSAVAFGPGDFHTPTERRPPPPAMDAGDVLELGPLRATVTRTLGYPRLVDIRFDGTPDAIWAGLARHGRPIQYSYLAMPLALWDVWTVVAGPPVAFEPPSAGFVLDWQTVLEMRRRSIQFATITHVPQQDAELGAKRPEAVAALVAAVEEKLDATRRLRLARDRWELRLPAFTAYGTAIRAPMAIFGRMKPSLEDIKSLSGSSPASLTALQDGTLQLLTLLSAIIPPEELAAAHALMVSAAQMAANAVTVRRDAALANDMNRAWNASSAAAGALMLGTRAREDILAPLRPPQLP